MPFGFTVNETASALELTLTGDLDSATAPKFYEDLEAASVNKPRTLVLHVQELVYMSSGGIRVLVLLRRKLAFKVYLVAPNEQILETLKRTSTVEEFDIVDRYP